MRIIAYAGVYLGSASIAVSAIAVTLLNLGSLLVPLGSAVMLVATANAARNVSSRPPAAAPLVSPRAPVDVTPADVMTVSGQPGPGA